MNILSKILRSFENCYEAFRNTCCLTMLRLKYPSIEIKGKTFVEKGCKIVCVDGGKLILDGAHISYGTYLIAARGARLEIKNSFIGRNCILAAKQDIQINNYCEIAEMVVIRDQDHKHDLTSKKISEQGYISEPITLESNVWIGAKVTILKGVTIGSSSIVGANSVVNKSIPEASVSVGVPAKIIRRNG